MCISWGRGYRECPCVFDLDDISLCYNVSVGLFEAIDCPIEPRVQEIRIPGRCQDCVARGQFCGPPSAKPTFGDLRMDPSRAERGNSQSDRPEASSSGGSGDIKIPTLGMPSAATSTSTNTPTANSLSANNLMATVIKNHFPPMGTAPGQAIGVAHGINSFAPAEMAANLTNAIAARTNNPFAPADFAQGPENAVATRGTNSSAPTGMATNTANVGIVRGTSFLETDMAAGRANLGTANETNYLGERPRVQEM
jgi:hypothetical protein